MTGNAAPLRLAWRLSGIFGCAPLLGRHWGLNSSQVRQKPGSVTAGAYPMGWRHPPHQFKLKARSFPNQKTEAKIGAYILNKMTAHERPEFESVA